MDVVIVSGWTEFVKCIKNVNGYFVSIFLERKFVFSFDSFLFIIIKHSVSICSAEIIQSIIFHKIN